MSKITAHPTVQLIAAIATIVLTTWLVAAQFINPRFDDMQNSIDRIYNHLDNHVHTDINGLKVAVNDLQEGVSSLLMVASDVDELEGDVDSLERIALQAHIERNALAEMIIALANGEGAETIAGIWEIVSTESDT